MTLIDPRSSNMSRQSGGPVPRYSGGSLPPIPGLDSTGVSSIFLFLPVFYLILLIYSRKLWFSMFSQVLLCPRVGPTRPLLQWYPFFIVQTFLSGIIAFSTFRSSLIG